MEIEYSVSEEDFLTYGQMSVTSSAAYKNGRWLVKFFTIMGGLAALLMLSDVLKGITNTYRWSVQAVVFLFFLWTFVTSDHREKLRIEKYLRSQGAKDVVGKEKLKLQEDSLLLSGDGHEAVYQMSRVTEIVDCPEHVWIRLGPLTAIVPRKKVESGNLQQFVEALKAKGVPSSTFVDEKRDRIQPGIYAFIAAAVSFIPALVGYVTYSNVKLEQFSNCIGEGGFGSVAQCFSFLSRHEIMFLCATPVFVFLLMMSLWMFYKTRKIFQKTASQAKTRP